ncbi:MAG: WYL domain-containing protein, partial [Leptospiraceae bacterium]|nr:WYL domain-containing protein [Leptospiraceae bacterium]
TVNNLFEVLEILGLIENSGKYFGNTNKEYISDEEIKDILSKIYNHEKELTRRIKTAKKIYNSKAKYSKIEGNKKGSYINFAEGKILKEEPIYKALFVIGLSHLVLYDSLNLDFLNQFFQQEFPLSFLLFLNYSIKNKIILSMEYESDRTGTLSNIIETVPLKINYRDGHWVLISLDIKNNYPVQYKIHNIISINLFTRNSKNPIIYDKEINFNLKDFYKNSFGLSSLRDREIIEIEIFVPFGFKEKIQKRRREGEWRSKGNDFIWKIRTQVPDEVFDYIFRWNGNLKILSPKSIKKQFQDKLKKFLD